MDIQIQTFAIDDNVPALGYQTKYQLKNEPQTTVQLGVADSHNAMTYLKGQFVSIMAAAAHVLGNNVTDATWNRIVQAMPPGHWMQKVRATGAGTALVFHTGKCKYLARATLPRMLPKQSPRQYSSAVSTP